MISIRSTTSIDFPIIRDIAYKTWPETYGPILGKTQLEYMLNKFYSVDCLQSNVANNQEFFIIEENTISLGFLGIENKHNKEKVTKIHKIYILPNNQGKGIGKLAIDFVADLAKNNNSEKLRLNVNKFNKAIDFYRKIGFDIVDEVVIAIGNDYVMDDYVMEKKI
jgi:diamine N-acetyltransferase